jgi:hypothetical protein
MESASIERIDLQSLTPVKAFISSPIGKSTWRDDRTYAAGQFYWG